MDARERLREAVRERFLQAAQRFQWFAHVAEDAVDVGIASEVFAPPSNPVQTRKRRPAPPSRAFSKVRDAMAAELHASLNASVFDDRLAAVPMVWSVHLNRTAGRTVCTTKGSERMAAVELAVKVVDREDRLRSTLAHELCHAAVHLIDRVQEGPHGPCFRKWARRVMIAFPDIAITTRHSYEIEFKYRYACQTPGCGARYGRHSPSIDVERARCGRCHGVLVRQ